ncbi:hypothetical protein ENSA5_42750 [Enhygromyxa salina]|uniref:Uncharacterized protein n=1 Tax=Enhygromyxa salina TaxID=215803 RepID=A0A2S9XKG6_9BACT|nr:hypothetical protein ENSA5_42750 [Enhygromyxa salina]
MEADEAGRRRESWAAAGNKPCAHESVTSERFGGMSSGDYVCLRCGKEFTSRAELPRGCSIL